MTWTPVQSINVSIRSNHYRGKDLKGLGDFRKALEDKQVDALVVAAPDHWHAPAAILASKAGKNVYLEKPCSHNPFEGELLTKVQAKYKNVIQMGNQRRSFPNVITAIEELKNGCHRQTLLR